MTPSLMSEAPLLWLSTASSWKDIVNWLKQTVHGQHIGGIGFMNFKTKEALRGKTAKSLCSSSSKKIAPQSCEPHIWLAYAITVPVCFISWLRKIFLFIHVSSASLPFLLPGIWRWESRYLTTGAHGCGWRAGIPGMAQQHDISQQEWTTQPVLKPVPETW